MVVSYCAFRCKNRHIERAGLGFYQFPTMDHAERLKWVQAVKRKRGMPAVHSQICGDHFVSGMYVNRLWD